MSLACSYGCGKADDIDLMAVAACCPILEDPQAVRPLQGLDGCLSLFRCCESELVQSEMGAEHCMDLPQDQCYAAWALGHPEESAWIMSIPPCNAHQLKGGL